MTDHRSKMAPTKDAPPGLESDGKGNVIPFEKRTKDDQEKVRETLPQISAKRLLKTHTGGLPTNPRRNIGPVAMTSRHPGYLWIARLFKRFTSTPRPGKLLSDGGQLVSLLAREVLGLIRSPSGNYYRAKAGR